MHPFDDMKPESTLTDILDDLVDAAIDVIGDR